MPIDNFYKPHPKQIEFYESADRLVLYGGGQPTRGYYNRYIWSILRRIMDPKYTIDPRMQAQLENNFRYHPPQGDQQDRYVFLRDEARVLAYNICRNTPPSREQALAITNLEQAIFWANAAIARNEPE